MRPIAAVLLLAVAGALPASADPKPAGCGGVTPAVPATCTFAVSAGSDGGFGYNLAPVATGPVKGRLDLYRGSTLVFTTGMQDFSEGTGMIGGFDGDKRLAPGTYSCRAIVPGASSIAYACAAD